MKTFLALGLLLGVSALQVDASDYHVIRPPEMKWGLYDHFSSWRNTPYEAEVATPFFSMQPMLREFPELHETFDADPYPYPRLYPMLLSREDPGHRAAVQEWQAWWLEYGENVALSLPKKGLRDEAVWSILAPTPYLVRPTYPFSIIPGPWTTITYYYMSEANGMLTQGVLRQRRVGGQPEIHRLYRDGWDGRDEWAFTVCPEFTRNQAHEFLAMIIDPAGDPRSHAEDPQAVKDALRVYSAGTSTNPFQSPACSAE